MAHLDIFLVNSTQTGLIAAKVMQKNVFDQNEWGAARILSQGEPIPFVVQFNAAKMFEQQVVILMDLDNIIKRKSVLSGGTIRAIAKQLLQGINMIHQKGLVHRDIKGENIMLHNPIGSDRVIVKIADFGLVKFQDRLQQTMLMSAKGTPLNMAPELVIGDGKADSKVDVWSVGVVLFQLVGHEYPIKAMSIPDLMKLMQLQTINRPSSIQDNLLWDLLIHLLAFDRTKRFTAAEALQHPYFTNPQARNEIKWRPKYHII
ncbi:MAG: putative myosin light chain kinase [Streblomastix strix]|nr:MAG: putative myosin light chain kinase [Streblomastix strix]